MDLIYKIYSVFLYDNQLNHDYLILSNRYSTFSGAAMQSSLPYGFGRLFNVMSEDSNTSIKQMKNTCDIYKFPFIKNNGFLTLEKVTSDRGNLRPTGSDYNIYDIYWNETKSGINIHEFEVLSIWNIGNTSYSQYRILEYKDTRKNEIRNYRIDSLISQD